MFTGKVLHLIPWKCKRRTCGDFVFVVLTSELCCWAEMEFELDILSWTSLWGSSPAGGPGSCQLQATIKSKPWSQWRCCACGNAVPTLWGMSWPGAGHQLGQWLQLGLISLTWNLTLHPCQGMFSCFCSPFWAGRCLCAKVWSQLWLSAFYLYNEERELHPRAQFCLQKVWGGRKQIGSPSREAVA